VFRDTASLAANPDLWTTIRAAMAQSRYFVLLASPESARSPWVQREVAFWHEHREPGTLLIALTDGEIHWDPDASDFDWARTTALPEQLRGWFAAEALLVDLTWARTETHLSMRHPRFRDACGTLAASIHGIPKDRLDSADIRQHRIARRLETAVVAVLVLLLIVATSSFNTANEQRRTAVEQRTVAEQQRAVATGRALQAEAENAREAEPQDSLRFSLAAMQVNPTPEARAGLVATLMGTHFAGQSSPAGAGRNESDGDDQAAFSPDGHTLVTAGAGADHALTLWDTSDSATQPKLAAAAGHTDVINDIAFSPDGNSLATSGKDDTVILWDLTDRSRPRRTGSLNGVTAVAGAAFDADATTLATVGSPRGGDGTLVLWDIRDRANPRRLAARTGVYDSSSVAFSPNGRVLVTATTRISGTEDLDRGTMTLTRGSGATV
jgi:hypothetical protein